MTAPAPVVDRDQVAAWFTLLYGGACGYLNIVSTRGWAGVTYPLVDGLDRPLAHVEDLHRRGAAGIYSRVSTLVEPPPRANGHRGRGKVVLTASLPALWLDLDIEGPGHQHQVCAGGEVCTHLAEGTGVRLHARPVLPLPPDEEAARAIVEVAGLPEASVWIHSGGGLYPLWLLDPVHQITDDLAEVAAISAHWQDAHRDAAAELGYHYGAGIGDLARVLRIPGTWNRKADRPEPAPCRLLADTGRRYALTELAAALERIRQRPVPPGTPHPPPPTRRPASGRPPGDVKPGVDFNARCDWSDPLLLGGLGWTVTYQRPDGERGWLRRGATSDLSATTGRGGHDNLWVFSTETPFPVGEVISKFEAFRLIHGYASHKEATLALNRVWGFGSAAVRPVDDTPAVPPALPELPPWPADTTVDRPATPSPNGAQRAAEGAVDSGLQPLPTVDNKEPPDTPAELYPGAPPDDAGQFRMTPDDDEPEPDEPTPAEDEEDEEEVDTWEPIDLGPYLRGEILRAEPVLGMRRTDGVRLIYPGKEHAVIGEMEAGKGWFALACAVEEMRQGRRVLYVHFEEADPLDTVERLRELGCTDEMVLTYFAFVGPSKPIKPKQRRRLARIGAALVILDGVNEGMSLHKADIRDENGAAEFRRIMVKPFTRRGAAVISLDHVVKDREVRDRYALGSIHKGNALDGALIVLETEESFGRNQRGRSHVYVVKDRPGFLRQHGRPTKLPGKTYMGEFVVDDRREAGASMSVHFYAPANLNAGDIEAPEPLDTDASDDERVLIAITELTHDGEDATMDLVRAHAQIRVSRARDAVARLRVAGRIREVAGPRNARVFLPLATDGDGDLG